MLTDSIYRSPDGNRRCHDLWVLFAALLAMKDTSRLIYRANTFGRDHCRRYSPIWFGAYEPYAIVMLACIMDSRTHSTAFEEFGG